jgi:hypothetical protein
MCLIWPCLSSFQALQLFTILLHVKSKSLICPAHPHMIWSPVASPTSCCYLLCSRHGTCLLFLNTTCMLLSEGLCCNCLIIPFFQKALPQIADWLTTSPSTSLSTYLNFSVTLTQSLHVIVQPATTSIHTPNLLDRLHFFIFVKILHHLLSCKLACS